MKQYKVYVLVDPIETEVRYVGITSSSLKQRLSGHVNESKTSRVSTYKLNWINSLKKVNSKPFIRLLKSFDTRDEAAKLEKELIIKYKVKHKLTNEIVDEGKFTSDGYKSAINLKNVSVFVYSYEGIFICKFDSIKECSEKLNIYESTIDKCLSGQYKYAKKLQFSREKVDKMPDLTNYSKDNWINLEILDTSTNKILYFPNRKKAVEFLNLDLNGNDEIRFLASLNKLYGNRYKVKINGEWKQSTYYNTGVKLVLENDKVLFFKTKKELWNFLGFKGGFNDKQLLKNLYKKIPNVKEILFSLPLIEVI